MAPVPVPSVVEPPASLGELLALASSGEWYSRVYAQCRSNTGGLGASAGPHIDITADTEAADIERALVLRIGGPIDVLCRLRALKNDAGATKEVVRWSPMVRVEVGAAAARAYLADAPSPVVDASDPVAALRAELASTRAALDEARKPSGTSVVASDPFSIAIQLQKLQNDAAQATMAQWMAMQARTAAPAPTSTTPTDHTFWLTLGERLAKREKTGVDWASLLGALGPTLNKLADAAGTVAEARRAESEARLADAAARAALAGSPLRLVESPAASATSATDAAGE